MPPTMARPSMAMCWTVMSRNTYVTLLTNLGQSQIPSHLSCHHHTTSPKQHPSILTPVCPLVLCFCLSPVMFRYCPVIVSCLRLLSCQLRSRIPLTSLIVSNCILILVDP